MYIQTRAHAAAIAEFLRDTHETPTLVYNLTGVQGRGLRTLGERIRIIDSEVMTGAYSTGRDGYIIGVQWSFSQQGYFQDLELIDAAGLFKYTLDEMFIIGTDTLGSAKHIYY